MITELFANNAFTTLAAAVTTTPAAGTSEVWQVASTSVQNLPQPATGVSQMRVASSPLSPVDTNPEIVLVTNVIDGTHWQVTRGAEGSPVKTHASGDQATCVLTLASLLAIIAQAGLSWVPTQTTAYTATARQVVPVDTTNGPVVITLPAGNTNDPVRVALVNGSNPVMVQVSGGGTINGATVFSWSTLNDTFDFSCVSPGVWRLG